MEAKKKYSLEYLDKCSYRGLQQIAKSFCLPCNFKKIYLKELILAKNVKSEKEINERINYIKMERKNNSGKKRTSQRKTNSEKSNLKGKENNKNQTKMMLSPPITITPKRTYVPRRTSPRFKNLFIQYRPKTLTGRRTPPRTYSSPRNKRLLKIKDEQIEESRIKNEQIGEVNDEIYYNLNDVTPIALHKEETSTEDLVNIYEVIQPPIKSRFTSLMNPSTSQNSYEEHIRNVSDICELLSSNQTKEDYPEIQENTINTSGFMDRINNYIYRCTQTSQSEIKPTIDKENNMLPEFGEAFANCNFPWIPNMQQNGQDNQLCMDNTQETILDFPDEFGCQNIYNDTEEGNDAMQLLESYLESPDEVGASLNISDLVDRVLGRDERKSEVQHIVEDLETVQCVICSRTGSKNLLEGHIKEEHGTRIHSGGGEYKLKYRLGELTCLQTWRSEVLQQDGLLYLLSVRYQDPEYCTATLSILSKTTMKKYGSITLYNSLTGEPHTWEGEIEPCSTNLPYYNENRGLNIQLEKLNLLPNSANLKLINRELVNSSLTKVIVGQPELNNIYLVFFVRIS